MEQSTYDPCLLYSNSPFGLVGLQTDDTLFIADTLFAKNEESRLHEAKLIAKNREQLTIETPLKFNGGLIRLHNNSISLTQEKQCNNLELVSNGPASATSSRGTIRQNLTVKEQYIV